MHALPSALLVRTFTGFSGSLAGEVAPCLRLSRDRTFRLRLSRVRTLLGDLRLFNRRGSRLAFGFCATGLSTLCFQATGFLLISLEVKLRGAKPLIGIAPHAYFFQALWLVLRADDSPLRFDEEG